MTSEKPPVVAQAVVLAAGRGSRMGAGTALYPKCLHPLAGRPILEWTMAALHANGIRDVLAVAGWQHQQLAGRAVQVRINPAWASSNMVRSLQRASDWLSKAPTLVVYGDGAYSPRAIHAALGGAARDIVVPFDRLWLDLWRRRFADPLADAETLAHVDDRLTGIGQRPGTLQDIEGQFMGLLRLAPTGWTRIARWLEAFETQHGSAAVDRMDMTGMLHRLIAAGEAVHCAAVDGGWVEIDSQQDCAAIEQALTDPEFRHDFRN